MEAYSTYPRVVFHCNPGCSTTAQGLQCHCTWVAVNIMTTIHRRKVSIARLVIN